MGGNNHGTRGRNNSEKTELNPSGKQAASSELTGNGASMPALLHTVNSPAIHADLLADLGELTWELVL